MEWIIGIGLLAAAAISYFVQQSSKQGEQRQRDAEREARIERLSKKYAGDPLLNDILAGKIRQGMTKDQVIDAWGPPGASEERVLKTKVVHTLKYGRINSRSFSQQVKIENGLVVGWTNR